MYQMNIPASMFLANDSKQGTKSPSIKLSDFPRVYTEKFSSNNVKNTQAFSLKKGKQKRGEKKELQFHQLSKRKFYLVINLRTIETKTDYQHKQFILKKKLK